MRHRVASAALLLLLAAPAAGVEGGFASLPRDERTRLATEVATAHKDGAPLPASSPFRLMDGADVAGELAGKRWTFVTLHVEARFDLFADGRLRVTYLASPRHGIPESVRNGAWRVEGNEVCLDLGSGRPGTQTCVLSYAAGRLILLGAVRGGPAGDQRAILGSLFDPTAIPAD